MIQTRIVLVLTVLRTTNLNDICDMKFKKKKSNQIKLAELVTKMNWKNDTIYVH